MRKILLAVACNRIYPALTDFLRLHDFQVKLALEVKQAIDLLEQEEFELMIASVNFPHYDGFSLTELLHNHVGNRFTPVILLHPPEVQENWSYPQVDAFLPTTIANEQLLEKIKKLLPHL